MKNVDKQKPLLYYFNLKKSLTRYRVNPKMFWKSLAIELKRKSFILLKPITIDDLEVNKILLSDRFDYGKNKNINAKMFIR